MKRVIKQVVGIDVAQDEFVVSIGKIDDQQVIEIYAHGKFANRESGFEEMDRWVTQKRGEELPVHYVMEATGVYHEKVAVFIDNGGEWVSIVLPNKISNYFRTLEVKTITDKSMSQAITQFGLERKLQRWQRPRGIYKELRQLTRERDQIVGERTLVKNQEHAEKAESEPNKRTLGRLEIRISLLSKQIKEIESEIDQLVGQDSEGDVKESVRRISTIPGVGRLTAVSVLAETNGFDLIRNRRQLASYAGFDVREKQSGTSVRGKSRISKKGNKYLRKVMYLPAWTAIRHQEGMKDVYSRLLTRHGIKMKAAVAVQRRLLELTYTLYKTKTDFQKDYHKNGKVQQMQGV